MVKLMQLLQYTDDLLEVGRFKDYCPNGLQVQGRDQVNKVISGVTASQALIDAAIEQGADVILVHHGYFWRGEDPCVVGMKRRRLARLLEANVSLMAYHLPLDAHPLLGNNAQLAERLGFQVQGGFGLETPAVGLYGQLSQPTTADDLSDKITQVLARQPLHIEGEAKEIHRIAWCTGAAQSYIEQAVALDVDAFLSGEISEQTVHVAREMGIHYFSAGHHATERYGVQALGQHLAQHFALEHHFIDVDNPV